MIAAQQNSEVLVLNRIIKQKLIGLHNKLSNTEELSLAEISLKETIKEVINLHNRQAGVFFGIEAGQFGSVDLIGKNRGLTGNPGLKTEQLFLILNELSACLILESKLYYLLKDSKRKSNLPEYFTLMPDQKRAIGLIAKSLNSYDKFTKV